LFKNEEEKCHQQRVEKLTSILSGEVTIDLHLQFLIRSNHSDMLILKNTKDAIRVSICHTATVIANAYMHSGTTSDQFLRWEFWTYVILTQLPFIVFCETIFFTKSVFLYFLHH